MYLLVIEFLNFFRKKELSSSFVRIFSIIYIILFSFYLGTTLDLDQIATFIPIIIPLDLILRIVFYGRINFDLKPFVLLIKKKEYISFLILTLIFNVYNLIFYSIFLALAYNVEILKNSILILVFCTIISINHIIISFKIREFNLKSITESIPILIYISFFIFYLIFRDFFIEDIFFFASIMIINLLIQISLTFFKNKALIIDSLLNEVPNGLGFRFFSFNPDYFIDIAFVLRNRRVREHIIFNLIFVLIIFFYQTIDNYEILSPIELLLFSVLNTGIIAISLGQYFLAWDSSYFSFLILNSHWKNYINMKFKFIFILTFILTFCEILICFNFMPPLGLYLLVASVFNVSVLFYTLMWFSYLNTKKIDLKKTIFFNYSGSKPIQILIIFSTIGFFLLFFSNFVNFFST
jgi:hypothetical protein